MFCLYLKLMFCLYLKLMYFLYPKLMFSTSMESFRKT